MPRVSSDELRIIVETDSSIDLTSFITTAHALTNHVVSQDVSGVLSTELVTEIEKYLAAHFYSLRDPVYRAKKTGGASATFQGEDGKRFESTHFGQNAIALDVSGTLAAMNEGAAAISMIWLGTNTNAATSYEERN